mmetsp:Transcript_8800/g.29333  ORF Transcript_8800/g.29333 Transcript_8800/m.29333 type:complete len:220 (-) Transcript_8800:913-1572(-)
MASSPTCSPMCLSFILPRTLSICCVTIFRTCPKSRGSNTMYSSTLLTNSGLKWPLTASITRSRLWFFWWSSLSPPRPSNTNWLPMLLVMMMMQFLKETSRPCESVTRPSSRTCSKTLNTSACAFSVSSKSTTLYGRRRTASVSCPPSSNPTYPGGAPINRETACFSIYSDMSIRTIASSVLNRNVARVLASSVFPTPVGPKNMKLAIGRFGSLNPARLR